MFAVRHALDSNASVWFATVVTFGELAIGLDRFLLPLLGTPWRQPRLGAAPDPP